MMHKLTKMKVKLKQYIWKLSSVRTGKQCQEGPTQEKVLISSIWSLERTNMTPNSLALGIRFVFGMACTN